MFSVRWSLQDACDNHPSLPLLPEEKRQIKCRDSKVQICWEQKSHDAKSLIIVMDLHGLVQIKAVLSLHVGHKEDMVSHLIHTEAELLTVLKEVRRTNRNGWNASFWTRKKDRLFLSIVRRLDADDYWNTTPLQSHEQIFHQKIYILIVLQKDRKNSIFKNCSS